MLLLLEKLQYAQFALSFRLLISKPGLNRVPDKGGIDKRGIYTSGHQGGLR